MKKKIIIEIIVILLIVTAIVCNLNLKKDTKDTKISDNIKFKNEYEELNNTISEGTQKRYPTVNIPQDNGVKYVLIQETLDILDSKTGIIYFGFPKCPWCRNAVPVLLNAASSTGVDQIYYLNISDVRDKLELDKNNKVVEKEKGKEGYKDLLKKLDSILDDYQLETDDGQKVETNEKRIYVPLVVFVKEGKIVSYHADTVESQKDPYVKLTNDQTEELYNIYVDGIIKMQDSSCDESC